MPENYYGSTAKDNFAKWLSDNGLVVRICDGAITICDGNCENCEEDDYG